MSSFLVVAPQGLGDALEATPIVGALKAAEPNSTVDVLVLRPGPRRLFVQLDGLVDQVLYYPFWERGLAGFAAALVRRRARRIYDAALLAYPAARLEYHLLARIHRARTRVAHDYWPGSNLRRFHTTLVSVQPKHNILRNLDLVEALGYAVDRSTSYVVPRSWTGQTRRERRIAIHVGTVTHHGLANKRWPVERFRELASRFAARSYEISVISGPDERDESTRLAREVPKAKLFEGTLDDVARFLNGCALAITNDSGIGHLAAAVGTSVLALHGPTPTEGGPYGPNAIRFRPSPCPPCFDPRLRNTSCALGIDFACLRRDLTVDAAERAALQLLGANVETGGRC